MVTRLLNLCGLDLGPADDLLPPNAGNPAGYWENRYFVALNDALLKMRGGAWDAPPVETDAWAAHDLAPLRARAADLVARFDERAQWGWKDPRNALTLSFWRRQIPGLRVVVCVRHPLEVAASLDHRADGRSEIGLELWLRYYRGLLATVGTDAWLVTHYDAYFHDPHAELRRVAGWLGLDVAERTIAGAVAAVRSDLRHERAPAPTLAASEVADCYRALCDAAGSVLRAAHAEAAPGAADPQFVERVLRWRADALEAAIATREERLAALTARTTALGAAVAAERARADAAASQLHDVTHSRAWRLMQWLWRLRRSLAPAGSRRERLWLGVVVPPADAPAPPPARSPH